MSFILVAGFKLDFMPVVLRVHSTHLQLPIGVLDLTLKSSMKIGRLLDSPHLIAISMLRRPSWMIIGCVIATK